MALGTKKPKTKAKQKVKDEAKMALVDWRTMLNGNLPVKRVAKNNLYCKKTNMLSMHQPNQLFMMY